MGMTNQNKTAPIKIRKPSYKIKFGKNFFLRLKLKNKLEIKYRHKLPA